MELRRIPAASTFVTWPMVDVNGNSAWTAGSVSGTYLPYSDTSNPTGWSFQGLTGAIGQVGGSTGVYRIALASTELPAASPYVMLRFTATGAATQYLLIKTATEFVSLVTADQGGRVQVSSLAAGSITAGVIATDAIDADAMADGAITAATFAAGAIDATAIATGAIDADAIAANAIGASELATDAVDEIVDAVWDEAWSDHVAANSEGQIMQRLQYATVYLDQDVGTMTTALAGSISSTSFAANALDAAAVALDVGSEFADALLGRNVLGGSSTGRDVRQALAILRNRVAISSGTLTVYSTDDTATLWTATVATTNASSIIELDP